MVLSWYIAHEAMEWAVHHRRAVCSLPTGTGRGLVSAIWLRECFERGITHAVLLEPNLSLVKHMGNYLRERWGIKAVCIDGHIPIERRRQLWIEPVVVCTPSMACDDRQYLRARATIFDPAPDDSCWFAFLELREACRFDYILLLDRVVPHKMRLVVELHNGMVRYWDMPSQQARLDASPESLKRELQWCKIEPFLPVTAQDEEDSYGNSYGPCQN